MLKEINELNIKISELKISNKDLVDMYEGDGACRRYTKREKKLSDENTKLYKLTNLLIDSQAFILRNVKN